MATAKITLIGMSRWMSEHNDDLFANLTTPSGIDRSKLINTILMNGGEFEVLYADADFMKFLIGVWSDKWQRTMEKWIAALSIVYNPLENYDRMEDWEDNTSRMNSEASSKNSTAQNESNQSMLHSDMTTDTETTSNLEDISRKETAIADDHSSSEGSGTTTNTVSAYDSSNWSNHDKADTTTSGENVSSSLTSTDGSTVTNGNSNSSKEQTSSSLDSQNGLTTQSYDDTTNTSSIGSENAIRSGRAHGNIGVTTSQQMLEAELDISKFNLYDEISNLFLTEFVVYTY